jgi:phage tail sheath protein FI
MTPEERTLCRQLREISNNAKREMDVLVKAFRKARKENAKYQPSPAIIADIEETLRLYKERLVDDDGA